MQKTYFISYNSADRRWAHWIAWTLERLGQRARIHEWEIAGGGNVPMWMEEALSSSDAMIAVVSPAFLNARYSQVEVHASNWRAFQSRDGFVKPVVVAQVVDWPIFLGNLRRLSLVGLSQGECGEALARFITDPVAPREEPPFPGAPATPEPASARPWTEMEPAPSPPPTLAEIDRLLAAQQRGTDRNQVSSTIADWLGCRDLPRQADETLGRLFNEDGLYRLNELGDHDGAISRFDRALDCHLRAFGPASDAVARVKSNKASALLEIGSHPCLMEALVLVREAVAAQEARFGPNPPEADISRLMTSRILLALGTPGDLNEADRLLDEASRVARTTQTSRDLDGMQARVAKRRATRAALLRAREIEQHLLSAVDENRISDETESLLNNLGVTLWALGDRDEAARHLLAALDLQRRRLHPDHPTIAAKESMLAALRSGEPSGFEPVD